MGGRERAAIRVENASKRFGRVRVLDGVNLRIEAGERVALIGANGAGKTTLIRCLLGEYRCEGRVEIDGRSPRAERAQVLHRMGFVPQLPPPLRMPVGQLLGFASALCGSERRRIEELAERLGLDLGGLLRRPFVKLSGGQKQKLLIALALRRESELLLLDEPAANLDPPARGVFLEMLSERGRAATMLVSIHRLDEVAHLVDRVLELDQGRLVRDERLSAPEGRPRAEPT